MITYNPSSELMMGEMDEIHEFMSRFERYVETKWGLYTDEKLGDKIKFTILATGFGIKDVPGMEAVAQKHSAEEQRRLAEQQQREDSNTTRRANVYKGMLENDRRKKDLKIYIFSQEDLDNDDIISVVETTPTYNRTKKALDSIKSKANIEEMPPAESGSSEDSSDPQKIFF